MIGRTIYLAALWIIVAGDALFSAIAWQTQDITLMVICTVASLTFAASLLLRSFVRAPRQ